MKRIVRLNESELKAMIYEAVSRILEDDDKKNVKPTQWYDTYVNKEKGDKKDGDIVQMRLNPDTMKPEFKSPTNDKVYDTRDAAINALNESFGGVEEEIKKIAEIVADYYENETGEEYNGEESWPIREVLNKLGYKPCGNDYWCKGDIKLEVYFDKGDGMWCIDPAD